MTNGEQNTNGHSTTSTAPESKHALRRLSLAKEASNLGIWEWRIEPDEFIWDERTIELVGFSPTSGMEELLAAVYREDREAVCQTVNHVLETKQDAELDFRIIRDGEILWVKVNEKYVSGEGNESDCLIGSVQDITEQKQTTHKLRRIKQKYELMFDNVQDALFLVDVEGQGDSRTFRFVRFNKSIQEKSGLPVNEMIGKTPFEMFDREVAEGLVQHYTRCVEEQSTIRYTEELETPSGSGTWDTQLTPLIEKGRVEGILGATRDVTGNEMMRKDLELFREAIEKNPDQIFIVDPETGQIQNANESVEDMLGYKKSELLTMKMVDMDQTFTSKDDWTDFRERVIEEGPHVTETMYRRKDGSTFPVELKAEYVQLSNGNPVIVATARNISKRRSYKQESLMKSSFVSRVTHDLRTPLNSITGMGTLLMNTEITSEQQGHLRTILNAARNMERLTNDILDLDRIERGELSLNEQYFTLTSVLGEVVSLHEPAVDERDLMLTTEVGENVPEHLIGDPNRLRQILHNLVDNAVRHTREGTITISVDVRGEDTDEGTILLEFAVQDTGDGVPEEKREDIFEQHEQARAPGQPQSDNGLGLGLSICRELVNLMNGEISVQSEEGEGSTFSFTAHMKEGTESSVVDFNELEVLLVDDNEHVRSVFRTYLEEVGVTVSECDSGNDALNELDGSRSTPPYDVVFMDLQMDSMSGIEVVRTLSEAANGLDTDRIFVVTGTPGEDVKAQLGSVPIAGVLEKPLNESDVLNAVKLLTGESDRTEPMDLDGLIEQIRQIHPAPVLTIVVEDNTDSQKLMKDFLEPFAKEVIIVTSGREGVDRRFGEPEPDLMMMDFELPDLNGIDAIKEIRREESARNIPSVPIIAQTAMAMTHVERKFMEAGADRFIRKPIKQDKLYRAIRDVFQDKQKREQFNGDDS